MGDGARERRGESVAGTARRRRAATEPSAGPAREVVLTRLYQRREELEAAILTRSASIADPREVGDPAYPRSLEAALRAALDSAFAALGRRRESAPPESPEPVLAHARLAARDRVPLETVLRRHLAADALLGDFLVAEAERARLSGPALRRLLATRSAESDRLIAAVGAGYAREAGLRRGGAEDRRRETVKRLLAGELVDHTELGYDLDAWHLALMARGEGGAEVLRELARASGRPLLIVRREEEPTWAAWLGGRRAPVPREALDSLLSLASDGIHVTLGEPGEGLTGWRFSHRQAKAALPIAERRGSFALAYSEVVIEAAAAQEELLAESLRRLYIAPLTGGRDGGAWALETLRAYFTCGRGITSAAARLGVDRRTVRNRLRAIEELLPRPLQECATDLELALRLTD